MLQLIHHVKPQDLAHLFGKRLYDHNGRPAMYVASIPYTAWMALVRSQVKQSAKMLPSLGIHKLCPNGEDCH